MRIGYSIKTTEVYPRPADTGPAGFFKHGRVRSAYCKNGRIVLFLKILYGAEER